jgi:hypothetical protein
MFVTCVQDEWVVCRIFQKNSGGKRSFLFSDSRMRQAMGYQLEDARSSLPPMMDNSPNPTVTDEGTCTDCETCAGMEQMSCYNCVSQEFHDSPAELHHHNKEATGNVMSWIAQPDNILQQVGSLNNLNNMLSKSSYPVYETCFDKSMTMSRFSQQALMQSANTMTTALNQVAGFRHASLRPKPEPSSLCEGEDEAQSTQKSGFDYTTTWPHGEAALYNHDAPGDSMSPLQSSTGGTDLSCLTGSLCSGENVHLFNFKYRLSDVTAPVDSGLGQEILWAY